MLLQSAIGLQQDCHKDYKSFCIQKCIVYNKKTFKFNFKFGTYLDNQRNNSL